MRGLRLLPVVVAVLLVACSGGDDDPAVILDGRARVPDVEGVLEQVSGSNVTIAGRRYELSRRLQAFSTYTLEAVPVRARRGQYVQAGVDGDEVVWLAAFGAVVRAPGARAAVYYTGVFNRTEDGRAVFRDGSTLQVGGGITLPKRGTRVTVEIDPRQGRIRALTPF